MHARGSDELFILSIIEECALVETVCVSLHQSDPENLPARGCRRGSRGWAEQGLRDCVLESERDSERAS